MTSEAARRLVRELSRTLRAGLEAPDWLGLTRELGRLAPTLPRLGKAKHPRDENVRFGQIPFLRFPPTEIADIAPGEGGIDAVIMVYFFGLLGVDGPMPLEFTHYVFTRSHNEYDNTWRRFLDIIHHRFLTFFYRAAAVNEQAISADRPDDDAVRDLVCALGGLPPDQKTCGPEREIVLKNALHFGLRVKTRAGLEDTLQRLFAVNLAVRDFITADYDIPPGSEALLGSRAASVLGVNLQIGRTYRSSAGKIEIRIGPEDFAVCRRFLPGEKGHALLQAALRLYLDRPLDYDIRLLVKSDSIPAPTLGKASLGASWLGRPAAGADGSVTLVKTVRSYYL